MPVYGPTKFGLSTNGALSGASGETDYPLESDVRYGVVYDNGVQTGTYLVVLPTPIIATNITGITHNLQIDQFANFSATITMVNTYNYPIDLSSYTVNSALKRNQESTSDTDFIITESDPSNGVVILSLTADQTGQLSKGTYYYDVVITNDSTQDTMRVLYGHARVSEGVTH